MKAYSGSEIRNVAVVGHNDTGKTTLVAQLLFNAGVTTRLGRIEDGTTTTDFDQDEIDRQRRNEETSLPVDLDYAGIAGLSTEVRQKLSELRPTTVGQASRIPGVTPAAVSILLIHLKKRSMASRSRVA